jgi:hypothetical protein
MKKSIIAIMCALLVLQALSVFAASQAYTHPASMAMRSTGVAARHAQIAARGCNLETTTDPMSPTFVGEARRECIEMNKNNLVCQRRCFEQVKLRLLSSSYMRGMGVYSSIGCNDVDASAMTGKGERTCYHDAGNACALANPQNDYCRKKCVQKTYAVCRQNVMSMRYR